MSAINILGSMCAAFFTALTFFGICQGLLRTTDSTQKKRLTALLIAHAVLVHRYCIAGPLISAILAFPYFDTLFTTLVNAWLVPNEQLRSRRDADNKDHPDHAISLPWALRLLSTYRGIGWNWQVKGVPQGKPQGYPKRQFLIETFLDWIRDIVLNDVLKGGMAIMVTTGLVHNSLVRPILPTFYWLASWTSLDSAYQQAVMFFIFFDLADPSECPPFFGSPLYAYTIRNFWGKFWHQKIRHFVQKPSVAVARATGFAKGSLGSGYVQLALSFLISGIYHDLAYSVGGPVGMTYTRIYGSTAIWIVTEDLVIAAGKRIGIQRFINARIMYAIGYLWTLLWMAWSGKALLEASSGGKPILEIAMRTWTYSIASVLL